MSAGEADNLRAGESVRRPARRSLVVFALMVAGYVTAGAGLGGVGSTGLLGIAVGALCVGAMVRGWACRAALCAAVLAGAAGWYTLRVQETAQEGLAWAAAEGGGRGDGEALVRVIGVVTEGPEASAAPRGALGAFARGGAATVFKVRASGVVKEDGARGAASGRVRVRVDEPVRGAPAWLGCGSVVEVTGVLRGVRGARNPGEPEWDLLARQEGRAGDVLAPGFELVRERSAENLRERVESWWYGTVGVLRGRVRGAIAAGDGDGGEGGRGEARALLGALLLGERDPDLREVNSAFTRLGLVHLVAISGFNLAVMAAVALFLLRLTGDRGWIEPAAIAVLVVLYMLVLPAQAPILRAGTIVLVLLAADAAGRRYDRLTLLGWVGCAAVVVRPLDVWSLGFQLSFGIVGVLLWMGDHVHERIWGMKIRGLTPERVRPGRIGARAWAGSVWRWGREAFKVQVSAAVLAWAVSMPVIASSTGLVSVLAPVMTLIVLPLTVVVLWGGYVALLAGAVYPPVGHGCAWVLERMAGVLVDVVFALDDVPGTAVRLPRLSGWWAAAGVGVALYWLWRGHVRDRAAWGLTVVVCVWLGVEVWMAPRAAVGGVLRVDTLAVGDGACHLVRSGAGADECMLWDCGSLATGVGERLVPEAVRALGAWRVGTVVVTHANLDHFSGLLDVVEPLGVGRVLVCGAFVRAAEREPRSAHAALLRGLAERGVRVEVVGAGDVVELGGARVRFVRPRKEEDPASVNDSSLTALVSVETECGERRVLFTGDSGPRAIAAMLEGWGAEPLSAEVMELPHHGAYHEGAAALLASVDPMVVMQSTGERRAGDPRWSGLMAGRVWRCTALEGAAWVRVKSDGAVESGGR